MILSLRLQLDVQVIDLILQEHIILLINLFSYINILLNLRLQLIHIDLDRYVLVSQLQYFFLPLVELFSMCLGICCHLSLKTLLDSYLVTQLALELFYMLLQLYLVLVWFTLVLYKSILQLIYLKVQLVVYSLDLALVSLFLLLKGFLHFLQLLPIVMAILL